MRKFRTLMAILMLSSLAVISCKDNKSAEESTNEQSTDMQNGEMTTDTTSQPTGPPVDEKVPGVESGAGEEHVP